MFAVARAIKLPRTSGNDDAEAPLRGACVDAGRGQRPLRHGGDLRGGRASAHAIIRRPLGEVRPSARWRALLGDSVAVYEAVGFGHGSQLHPEEAALVSKAVTSRVEEFAAGRVCARQALADLGYPPAPLLRRADRRPAWPAGCYGSITHTEGHCAAAVALAGACAGLGIDVEVAGRVGEAIEPRICTPAELVRLRAMPEARRRVAATVIFSAKEAFYKSQSHLPDALKGFHDVELRIDGETFVVIPLGRIPQALRPLGRLVGRYAVDGGLVYSGVMLAPTPRGGAPLSD